MTPSPPAPVTFERYRNDESEQLVALLSGDTWPFQRTVAPTPKKVRSWISESVSSDADQEAHWVVALGGERVGVLHLEELTHATATTDFRLQSDRRGRGYGRAMAKFAADRVFSTYPTVVRLAAVTRIDNIAMQRVLRATPGWALEAYYRRSWPDASGTFHDSLGFAILRDD